MMKNPDMAEDEIFAPGRAHRSVIPATRNEKAPPPRQLTRIGQILAQAERLRQSILKKAFEGRLVAQDASDEPAGVLLERIKSEKARREEIKRKR